MADEKKVWGIHTQDDSLFLQGNVIAIGWKEMGDLSVLAPDRESFRDKYFAVFPETKSQGLFHQIQKEITFCGLPHGADA